MVCMHQLYNVAAAISKSIVNVGLTAISGGGGGLLPQSFFFFFQCIAEESRSGMNQCCSLFSM